MIHSNGFNSKASTQSHRPAAGRFQSSVKPERPSAEDRETKEANTPKRSTSKSVTKEKSEDGGTVVMKVGVEKTNLRLKPSTDSLKHATVRAGEKVTVLDEENKYVKVRLESGKTSWLLKSDLVSEDE